MLDFDNALIAVQLDALKIAQLEQDRLDLLKVPLNPAMKDERDQGLKREIDSRRQLLLKVLQELIQFPPQHTRHGQLLAQFHGVATFPDKKKPSAIDAQLENVIQAVRNAVQNCGYVARLASDNQYHNILWDNVELYLLGCNCGIAIVEDKYRPELNPNVAMEWGWMRGMGRNVLYLIEKDFTMQRADWGGLIQHSFEWTNPGPAIKTGVEAWLKNH